MLDVNNTDYIFSKDTVSKIILEFKKQFKDNISVIKKAISTDEKLSMTRLDIELLKSAFNKSEIPIIQSDTCIVDGIGTLGVVYNGNPYITLYLSLATLRTHNRICFFVNDSMLATNTLLVNMLNKIIKNFKYGNDIIKLYNNVAEKDLIESQNLFSLYLYIGNKHEYTKFSQKINTPIVYNGYENAIFYIDGSDKFNDNLIEINDYVFNHNLRIETYRDDYIDAVKNINTNSNNDLVVLFTPNKVIAKYFVENVKCKKLVINKIPFDNYTFDFDEEILVTKKEIIF